MRWRMSGGHGFGVVGITLSLCLLSLSSLLASVEAGRGPVTPPLRPASALDQQQWQTPEYLPDNNLRTPAPIAAPSSKPSIVIPASQFEGMRFQESFPSWNQVRAVYGDRRRMAPYGGMDMTTNPYRAANDYRGKAEFFSPRTSNGMTFGPDPGLALANIINSQHSLLTAGFNSGMRRMGLGYENSVLSKGFGLGGPGFGYFNRLQRPYGIDPYVPPFSYYSPPPLPSTSSVPPISTSGPGGDSSGSSAGGSSS